MAAEGQMSDGADGDPGELVQILFELEVEDGWPPVAGERMWAEELGDDTYRVASVPWFVRDIAEGDVVRAASLEDGSVPLFLERVSSGGSCTIRVVPSTDGEVGGDLSAVLDAFEPLGVSGEGCGPWPIVALTVPADVDAAPVLRLLRQGRAEGRWHFEEGCVSPRWLSL